MTTRKIEIMPYDPKWLKLFEVEAKKVKIALGGNCVAVHHIGSTFPVVELEAKPLLI